MLRPALFAAVAGLSNGHGIMWLPWSRANIAENNGWESDSTSIIAEPMPDVAPRGYPDNRPWSEPGQSLSNIGPCGSKPYGSQTNWNKPEHGWGTEVTATYRAGDVIDVEWCITSSADHGGSYSYRLCTDESITAKFINPDYTPNGDDHAELEDCFQRGILSCHDVPGQNCRVHPSCHSGMGCMQASSWFHCDKHMSVGGGGCMANRVGSCRGNGGLLRDRVKLPANFASNHTLIGFRWDCQQTGQLWLHCADVKILQGNGQPAPPTPAPAPTPEPPTPVPTPAPLCGVAESNRRECGFSTIDENGCRERGCCWKSSAVSGVPWCFDQAVGNPTPAPAPTPEPPTPAPPAPTPEPPTPAPTTAPQCGVAESSRRDCGFSGIDENGCRDKGCCWTSSGVPGVPWCFDQADGSTPPAPSPPGNQCDVSENQRQDCGYFGIDQNGCERDSCCWRESSSGAPWCYYGASSASFIQNAHKKGGEGSQCRRDVCREVALHAHAKHSKARTQVCQKTMIPC